MARRNVSVEIPEELVKDEPASSVVQRAVSFYAKCVVLAGKEGHVTVKDRSGWNTVVDV